MTQDLIRDTFEAHQPAIAAYAQASPEAMARVYRFVLATIQQPLFMTPEITAEFEAEGAASRFAFGMKATALNWLAEPGRAEWLHSVALDTWRGFADPVIAERETVGFFACLPGLGLIKAGFMVQLCFGAGGCLDRHNFARFGLPENAFKASAYKGAKREATRLKHLEEYLSCVRRCGGAALLWAEWCEYVAARDPGTYQDAAHVSRLHLDATVNLKAA